MAVFEVMVSLAFTCKTFVFQRESRRWEKCVARQGEDIEGEKAE